MSPLHTDRLILRDFRVEDAAAVHAFCSDPVVCRHTDWGPNSPEDSRAFVAEASGETAAPARQSYSLAMMRREDHFLIGSCAVWIESVEHKRGALGFVVAPEQWGNGYASEAAGALLRFAFEVLGLERVEATCRPANAGSRRVLARIGMRQEGVLRSHLSIRGRREDSLLFAALPRDLGDVS